MAQTKIQIPLKEIVDSNENVYEITNAAIKRAAQITVSGDEALRRGEGKIVSAALKEVITNVVDYKIEDE
jgi:DNA-directed RNA polymerase subunit omega